MEARRPNVRAWFAERHGKLEIALRDGGRLELRGKGDLVELMADGTLAITDYKTGEPPGLNEVASGLQPQLTLMAAMAMAGALDGVPKAAVSELRYVKLGRASKARPITFKNGETPAEAAARHLKALADRMSDLRTGRAGYVSRRRLKKAADVGPYDHLARAAEWRDLGGEDEEPDSDDSSQD